MNRTTDTRTPLLAPLATIPACQRPNADADWFPPVDILEDDQEYVFKIDLPEVRPGEVRVVVERGGLFISGRRGAPAVNGKQYLRVERPHGYFERRFALPDDASRVQIDSDFADNVLELRIRKVHPLREETVAAETVPVIDLSSSSPAGK